MALSQHAPCVRAGPHFGLQLHPQVLNYKVRVSRSHANGFHDCTRWNEKANSIMAFLRSLFFEAAMNDEVCAAHCAPS